MRYRLKKDLPFAKAGEVIDLVNDGKSIQYRGFQCDIKGFEGTWIEEVKPREFILVLDCSGNYVAHFPTTYTVHEVVNRFATSHQIIKVREVIK